MVHARNHSLIIVLPLQSLNDIVQSLLNYVSVNFTLDLERHYERERSRAAV